MFSDDMTLAEARDILRELARGDGHRCPVCTQFSKVYRWSLYGTAVRALALYYRLGGTTEFIHSRALKEHGHRGQGDASRLNHWGLVEEETARREDGGRSGYWRVTERGEQFLRRSLTIPKYCHVYDSRVLSFSGPDVDVVACLGKFDYGEMMRGI